MISATEALERLREGNERFVSGSSTRNEAATSWKRRSELVAGQEPFAVILGCSDSRVPAEIIFDQGLGDLFVIRIAGNVAAPSQIGSVEFAAKRFNTRLVVVLGHSQCGAITATIEELQQPTGSLSPSLRSIVDRIRPSLEPLLEASAGYEPDALMRQAVRANVKGSVNQLKQESSILDSLVETDGLLIVGAEYSLDSGRVDFFDVIPGSPGEFEAKRR